MPVGSMVRVPRSTNSDKPGMIRQVGILLVTPIILWIMGFAVSWFVNWSEAA